MRQKSHLFSKVQVTQKTDELLLTTDNINEKMGKDTVKLASQGFKEP